MFCDIEQSTELISQLSPEVAQKVLSKAIDAMARAVHGAGGTTLKRLGDGVMAAFGVPVAQPDHALRACRAALEILKVAAIAFGDDRAGSRHSSRVRIGLNSGEVAFSMEHPSSGATELDVIGDQVSLAARVESSAEPGTVYMTEATRRRVQGLVTADYAGTRALKGFPTPVALYRLRTVVSPADAPSAFVGRSRELQDLRQCLVQLREGHGCVALLFGEPGIGKTRLIEELRREDASTDLLWLRAASPSLSENVAYWACGELLQDFLRVTVPPPGALDWETLVQALCTILVEDARDLEPEEAAAFLARILRIEVPEPWKERLDALDGDAAYRQTLRVWWRFLDALAASHDVVLEFDDLQWIDPSSIAVISHVLPLVRERRIALIGCARSEHDGHGARLVPAAREAVGNRCLELHLGALASTEASKVLAAMVGTGPTLTGLRQLVLERSDGNPFFIEEIVRALRQMELLTRTDNGEWMLACPIEQLRLPESLQEFVLARVDRLDEGMREVVRVAAVIGRQFLYRVLAAVSERSFDIDAKVKALQRQELIDCMHQFPELEYIFKHAVIQETIYASLFEERRRTIHQAVAECLESLFPDECEPLAAILAYHYIRAEHWEKAQHYLFLAADQAEWLAADEDALRNFLNALEIMDRHAERRLTPLQLATVRRKLGNIQYRRGELVASRAQYVEGLRVLGLSDPRTRFGIRVSISVELLRHAVLRLIGHGRIPAAIIVSDGAQEMIALIDGLSWTYYHQDQERLLLGLLRGLNIADRAGSIVGVSKGSSALGYVLTVLGAFRLAATYHQHALECARAADNEACIGFAEYVIGLRHYYQGQLAQASQCFEDAQVRARHAGDWFAWGSVRMLCAQVALAAGDAPRAIRIADEAMSNAREVALTPALAWGHLARGFALHLMGQSETGILDVNDAISRAHSAADHQCVVHARGALALMLFAIGDFDGARQQAVSAASLIRQYRLRGHNTADTFHALAQIAAHDIEVAAPNQRRAQLRVARRACRDATARASIFLPAMPALLRISGTVEWLAGQRAEAIRFWKDGASLARTVGVKAELAAILNEHGRRAGEPVLCRLADEIASSLPNSTDEMKTRGESASGDSIFRQSRSTGQSS